MMAILLVAVGWLYVTVMMALVEATSPQGSVLGALVTLMLYGVLPLSVTLYILSTPWRRKLRMARERVEAPVQDNAAERPSLGDETPAPSSGQTDHSGHASR